MFGCTLLPPTIPSSISAGVCCSVRPLVCFEGARALDFGLATLGASGGTDTFRVALAGVDEGRDGIP